MNIKTILETILAYGKTVFVRYIAIAVAGWLISKGVAKETADGFLSFSWEVFAGLVVFGVNWAIASFSRKKLAESTPPATPTERADDTPPPPIAGKIGMLLIACTITFAMLGCGATEKNRIGQAYVTIDTTAQASTALLESGNLSIATSAKLLTALRTAQAAVDAWDNARLTGDATLISKSAAIARAALLELAAAKAQATVEAATPIERPL